MDSPSRDSVRPFYCEEGFIINVNKKNWTVDVETKHRGRVIQDVQCLTPYHHFNNGEGYHFMPEEGAECLVGFPSDHTTPIVMGFKGVPAAETEPSEQSATADKGEASQTDVSYRSKRPELFPGDLALTTRDDNFIVLRRGGVVQVGATPIAQRVYIPVLNFVKDFAENYELNTFGGDVSWLVERQENDPSGDAPCAYTFHLNSHAQDEKATVRIRHLPLSGPEGNDRAAWDVTVASKNIDRDTGDVVDEKYTLLITVGGEKTEFVGANRTITVEGDDVLDVSGSRTVKVGGDEKHEVTGSLIIEAGPQAILEAAGVYLGGDDANQPSVLGTEMVTWLSSLTLPVSGTTAGPVPPPLIATFMNKVLSRKVFLK